VGDVKRVSTAVAKLLEKLQRRRERERAPFRDKARSVLGRALAACWEGRRRRVIVRSFDVGELTEILGVQAWEVVRCLLGGERLVVTVEPVEAGDGGEEALGECRCSLSGERYVYDNCSEREVVVRLYGRACRIRVQPV